MISRGLFWPLKNWRHLYQREVFSWKTSVPWKHDKELVIAVSSTWHHLSLNHRRAQNGITLCVSVAWPSCAPVLRWLPEAYHISTSPSRFSKFVISLIRKKKTLIIGGRCGLCHAFTKGRRGNRISVWSWFRLDTQCFDFTPKGNCPLQLDYIGRLKKNNN